MALAGGVRVPGMNGDGFLLNAIGGALGFVAVLAGLATAAFRYAAVLTGRSPNEVERFTAVGFYAGGFVSALFLVVERVAA